MRINWKVRLKNKYFWMTAIPAGLVLIQTIAAVFGFTMDLSEISDKLLAVVKAAFLFLSVIGIVNDPTTKGLDDSKQALDYTDPK